MTDITTPSVYVGTYHKYNCGSIAGAWLDLTDFDSSEEFYERCRELHANEADPEFMFQDWEGIPSDMASECHINWDFINGFKQAREEGNADFIVSYKLLYIPGFVRDAFKLVNRAGDLFHSRCLALHTL